MKNILVLCTGNSCRSQMAHGYLNQLATDKATIYSAGIETHGLNPGAVSIMAEDGIDITPTGRKGSRIYKKKADGDFEAHLVALSCSDPPEGFSRWSLRLLADKVVELDYIDNISHETIRRVLKKTKSNLGLEKGG